MAERVGLRETGGGLGPYRADQVRAEQGQDDAGRPFGFLPGPVLAAFLDAARGRFPAHRQLTSPPEEG